SCRTGWCAPSAAASVSWKNSRCGCDATRPESRSVGAKGVRPAVRGLVQAHPLEAQVVAVDVAVGNVEQAEGFLGEILGGGHDVEQHRLVAGEGGEEVDDLAIAAIGEEGMVPPAHNLLVGNALDV